MISPKVTQRYNDLELDHDKYFWLRVKFGLPDDAGYFSLARYEDKELMQALYASNKGVL